MELLQDLALVIGSISIPLIVIYFKTRSKKSGPIENIELEAIKTALKKLELQRERDRITIDDLQGRLAFIEGRLSK